MRRGLRDFRSDRIRIFVNRIRVRGHDSSNCRGRDGQDSQGKRPIYKAQNHFVPRHCPETKIDTRILPFNEPVAASGTCATS